jgi:glycosyltransferase involved in cell wall biosynthesis
MPFISICIPAYKNTAFLQRLLDSIAIQSFTDYEVVITDDSPDDAVQQLIEHYHQRLSIHYHKNTPALGSPANWNKGLQLAKGEWIKMMHDDDWFADTNSLQAFADAASAEVDFIFAAYADVYLDSNKKVIKQLLPQQHKNYPLGLFEENTLGHPSVTMHRNIPGLQYNEQFVWVVDIDFYIRFLQAHPRFVYLEKPLINIGKGDTQISSGAYKNAAIEIKEYLGLYQKLLPSAATSDLVYQGLWKVFRRCNINSIEKLKTVYGGEIALIAEHIAIAQSKLPKLLLKQPPLSLYFCKKAFLKYLRLV